MYHYFIDDMELPLAPERYSLRLPKQNQVLQLVDGGQMSLLRPAGLREISFELLLPYFEDSPMLCEGVKVYKPIYYLNQFASWAASGEPRRLIIYRALPGGGEIFNTNMLVSLEDYQVLEAADLGFDVRVSLTLREYIKRVCQRYVAGL